MNSDEQLDSVDAARLADFPALMKTNDTPKPVNRLVEARLTPYNATCSVYSSKYSR